MALLLHLSDLHLIKNSAADVVADIKDPGVLALGDQQTRFGILRASLAALGEWLRTHQRTLDTIVVSGDVTVHGLDSGFDLLPKLLDALGESMPTPDRVLVVPGNHDVVRGTAPGSVDRYAPFLRLAKFGYRLAHLEGVSEYSTSVSAAGPMLAAEDNSFVVVGLNSSNHCQHVRTLDEPAVEDALSRLRGKATSTNGIGALVAAWDARALADAPMLGDEQLRVGRALLDSGAASAGPQALRVAAFHHQVLPVGANEEVKPYDSMTNLGEVRDWLVQNEVDVVLHGHKHLGAVGLHTHVTAADRSARPHPTLLVSAPTVQAGSTDRDPIGYLIDVRPGAPRAAGVDISEIPAVGPGGGNVDLRFDRRTIHAEPGMGIIDGDTVTDVHAQLVALRDRYDELHWPLVCTVQNGETALEPPHTLESPSGVQDVSKWFQETVSWWQLDRSASASTFTHGQRLRRFGAVPVDQVDHIVQSLESKRETTRAIAVLIDPTADANPRSKERPQFPSFALVQCLVKNGRLDLIAHFRKQEMPHWWAINMGELANLQQTVVDRLRKVHALTAGKITTVVAHPMDGPSWPAVVIPYVDRILGGSDNQIALAMALTSLSATGIAGELWTAVFADWRPSATAPADADPVPSRGLGDLARLLDAMVATNVVQNSAAVSGLSSQLKRLQHDVDHWRASTDPKPAARAAWVSATNSAIDEILALVNTISP